MSILNKLIEERKLHKIKQNEMAKQLGVTGWTLSHYEKGHRRMTLDMAEDYADKLGLEIRLLIK
jgi:DNA-binding XRE family transcriptional regulator